MTNQVTTISTPEGIEVFHMIQLKYALKLELAGMRHSRGSAYQYIKNHWYLKGNKQKVYDQFCEIVEAAKANRNG